MLGCRTPQPPAPGPGDNSARYPPTRWHSLVGPAIAHELVHLRGTLWWALHPLALLDEGHDLRPFHLLVGLLAVGQGLPHGDPIAPDIAAAGELAEVDALGRIPLERPLPG